MSGQNRIYPLFLPHLGCPFQCVYCNQHVVTYSPDQILSTREEGATEILNRLDALAEQARSSGRSGEIAFYGGTFTALPPETLRAVLEAASDRVREGVFSGIRFSTRPDCLSPETGSLLSRYPVSTVELGAQSLSDSVLASTRRGYTAKAVEAASALVREHGWSLGIQLMAGLPGDTKALFLESIRKAIRLGPSFVRIYPTLVLAGTLMAEWYGSGVFRPLELEDALDWCADGWDLLRSAGVPAARMGLHADPELEKPGMVLAGPYHPAFGYLVRVRSWRNRVDEALGEMVSGGAGFQEGITIEVAARQVSEAIGPGRSNLLYWQGEWNVENVRVLGARKRAPESFAVLLNHPFAPPGECVEYS
ncbi:MAG: elongator complex protein 3 [Acidobacteriota bacterium]